MNRRKVNALCQLYWSCIIFKTKTKACKRSSQMQMQKKHAPNCFYLCSCCLNLK